MKNRYFHAGFKYIEDSHRIRTSPFNHEEAYLQHTIYYQPDDLNWLHGITRWISGLTSY
jgi:hypothetical protein